MATGDFEVRYAFIVVATDDPNMGVLAGVGVDGEQVSQDGITYRYLGKEDGKVLFEISASKPRTTLAGTAQTVTDLVTLEGNFNKEDWIGVGISNGGLQNVRLNLNSAETVDADTTPSLQNQLKRQILSRGIDFRSPENPHQNTKLTARRYFMKRLFDESDT